MSYLTTITLSAYPKTDFFGLQSPVVPGTAHAGTCTASKTPTKPMAPVACAKPIALRLEFEDWIARSIFDQRAVLVNGLRLTEGPCPLGPLVSRSLRPARTIG